MTMFLTSLLILKHSTNLSCCDLTRGFVNFVNFIHFVNLTFQFTVLFIVMVTIIFFVITTIIFTVMITAITIVITNDSRLIIITINIHCHIIDENSANFESNKAMNRTWNEISIELRKNLYRTWTFNHIRTSTSLFKVRFLIL